MFTSGKVPLYTWRANLNANVTGGPQDIMFINNKDLAEGQAERGPVMPMQMQNAQRSFLSRKEAINKLAS